MKVTFFLLLLIVGYGCKKKESKAEASSERSKTVMMQVGSVYKRMNVNTSKLRSFPYHFTLKDQDGKEFKLSSLKGKVLVVGYIYTHCPDVCPMITANMRRIQKKINSDKKLRENVLLVSISFDPNRDTPQVLKKYAEMYKADLSDWVFLTGDSATIDSILNLMGIERIVERVKNTYFIAHTDRIHVIDRNGYLRGYFIGSQADPDTVVSFVEEITFNSAVKYPIYGPDTHTVQKLPCNGCVEGLHRQKA